MSSNLMKFFQILNFGLAVVVEFAKAVVVGKLGVALVTDCYS